MSKATATTKRPIKPSVLHRQEMLNQAYVNDNDITVGVRPIPEKTSDAEVVSENEDIEKQGVCFTQCAFLYIQRVPLGFWCTSQGSLD